MNVPEKIVQVYLRLNGFFTISHFIIFSDKHKHIDLLAVRLGDSQERIGEKNNPITLSIDDEFLKHLGVTRKDTIGLIIEVKGGYKREERKDIGISNDTFKYALPFFGVDNNIFRVLFKKNLWKSFDEEYIDDNLHHLVSLSHCLEFINNRLKELENIERDYKSRGILSKEGSWYLSETFLSELIYLKSLGFFG